VSYRNALMTISGRGWRREEPRLMAIIERPSLLPRAVEFLTRSGIDEARLIEQCYVPVDLFHAVTARTPADAQTDNSQPEREDRLPGGRGEVTSLLDRRPAARR
jgi:hypothetical protein